MIKLQYRLLKRTEVFGRHSLQVEGLADLDETIDLLFKELERTGDAELLEELCPYFGTVWPSARALTQWLVDHEAEVAGQRLLEVGCGLAIPSLMASRLGAQVVATDFHPEVPNFLERNLALNGRPAIDYQAIDWRAQLPEFKNFDWVIGSDVLYERQHSLQLAQVVSRAVSANGKIVIADPARPYIQGFADEMQRLGFSSKTETLTAADADGPKDIFILSFSRS